jgi:hypothetical protein
MGNHALVVSRNADVLTDLASAGQLLGSRARQISRLYAGCVQYCGTGTGCAHVG